MYDDNALFNWGEGEFRSKAEAEHAVAANISAHIGDGEQGVVIGPRGAVYRVEVSVGLVRDLEDEAREIRTEHEKGLHPFMDPDCPLCSCEDTIG